METLGSLLVAAHLQGLAAILGSFFGQLRRTIDFVLIPLLVGAVVQLVSGLALDAVAEIGGDNLNYAKIGVKIVIALVVLAAYVVRRKGVRVQP